MDHFSKLTAEQQKERIDRVNLRWKQLYNLEKDSADEALKFLFLVNSGGAVADLSFIGSIGISKIGNPSKISLICFVSGLVFVGISKAKTFHHMSNLFKRWRGDANEYFKDEITFEKLFEKDRLRAKEDLLDYILPYTSAAFFLLGCGVGVSRLFCG